VRRRDQNSIGLLAKLPLIPVLADISAHQQHGILRQRTVPAIVTLVVGDPGRVGQGRPRPQHFLDRTVDQLRFLPEQREQPRVFDQADEEIAEQSHRLGYEPAEQHDGKDGQHFVVVQALSSFPPLSRGPYG